MSRSSRQERGNDMRGGDYPSQSPRDSGKGIKMHKGVVRCGSWRSGVGVLGRAGGESNEDRGSASRRCLAGAREVTDA